jgi:hypothetical protein
MRITLALVALFVATHARGASLLVSIREEASSISINQLAWLVFATGNYNTPALSLGGDYRISDIGRVVEPDAITLQAISSDFKNPFGWFGLYTARSGVSYDAVSVDIIWTPEKYPEFPPNNQSTTIQTFAPRLGVGLTGYRVTSITQTVDHVSFQPEGDRWRVNAAQTIRIYGETIPEPGTWLLVAMALLACFGIRGRF